MKTVRLSLTPKALEDKEELLVELCEFLESDSENDFDYNEDGEIIEYDDKDNSLYWSVGEPVENMYNTYDVNLEC